MVSIEDFKKIELRVGKITDVQEHPTARNPMYILTIDFGKEIGIRTIVAGIRDRYQSDELLGKKIVCVVNLDPKRVANVDSNGMILAAENNDVLSLLVPDRDIDEGSWVH